MAKTHKCKYCGQKVRSISHYTKKHRKQLAAARSRAAARRRASPSPRAPKRSRRAVSSVPAGAMRDYDLTTAISEVVRAGGHVNF